MRVFLDANILFSAVKSDGAVRQLLRMLIDAGHECWIDPYVEAEARRNLATKASNSGAVLERLLADCHSAPFRPSTPEIDQALVALPEKDRPVLAAAIRLGCDVLVTGDRTHFGALFGTRVQGVEIHAPATLVALVLRRRK